MLSAVGIRQTLVHVTLGYPEVHSFKRLRLERVNQVNQERHGRGVGRKGMIASGERRELAT